MHCGRKHVPLRVINPPLKFCRKRRSTSLTIAFWSSATCLIALEPAVFDRRDIAWNEDWLVAAAFGFGDRLPFTVQY